MGTWEMGTLTRSVNNWYITLFSPRLLNVWTELFFKQRGSTPYKILLTFLEFIYYLRESCSFSEYTMATYSTALWLGQPVWAYESSAINLRDSTPYSFTSWLSSTRSTAVLHAPQYYISTSRKKEDDSIYHTTLRRLGVRPNPGPARSLELSGSRRNNSQYATIIVLRQPPPR